MTDETTPATYCNRCREVLSEPVCPFCGCDAVSIESE
jgi:hypothetical protein